MIYIPLLNLDSWSNHCKIKPAILIVSINLLQITDINVSLDQCISSVYQDKLVFRESFQLNYVQLKLLEGYGSLHYQFSVATHFLQLCFYPLLTLI